VLGLVTVEYAQQGTAGAAVAGEAAAGHVGQHLDVAAEVAVGVLPGRYSRQLDLQAPARPIEPVRPLLRRVRTTTADRNWPATRSRITRGRVMTQTQLAGTLAGCVNQQSTCAS
jgi:hypothetical protein